MKTNKSFSLLELLLVISLLFTFLIAVSISFYSTNKNREYQESLEMFKTLLLKQKYNTMFYQKESVISFDDNFNIINDESEELSFITNNLKIIDSTETNITFFIDGSIESGNITVTDNENTVTNTFHIGEIGNISYR